ncbi:restriction endonuclease subunit S [Lactococcus protaetiae]|uniref:restriction endonuclease subunit S n=1 Tax=Lactococcus protaetiae TaxID=2592653 RepID=UPI001CC1F9EC|nr:restriction endonuclease subunit S [Lactococcus protaetiae]
MATNTMLASSAFINSFLLFSKVDNLHYEKFADGTLKAVEVPFDIPESWEWVRFSKIVSNIFAGGDRPEICTENETPITQIPIYSNGAKNDGLYGYTDAPRVTEKSLTISGRGTIGYSSIRNSPFVPIVRLIVIQTNEKFIGLEFLKYFFDCILPTGQGTSIPQLTVPMLKDYFVALPPINEQLRLVKIIEQFFPKINTYAQNYNQLELINKTFPDKLRKSILQYAMQGKLVPQDPNDEPVEILLEKIRSEKLRLYETGKLKKKDLQETVIYKAEDNSYYQQDGENTVKIDVPFEIPQNWKWIKLRDLSQLVTDGTHKTPAYTENGIPFLSVQNISSGKFTFQRIKYISKTEHEILKKRVLPQKDDILFCRIGTLGKALKNTLDFEYSIFVSLGLVRLIDNSIVDFIIEVINSPVGTNWIDEVKVGGGTHTYKINLRDIPNFLLPVPPKSEQERIIRSISMLTQEINSLKAVK